MVAARNKGGRYEAVEEVENDLQKSELLKLEES